MNAKQWVGTPDGLEMFYKWYNKTDQYVTDRLEREHDYAMGDEQDFVYDYYRLATELGVIDENTFDF